MPDLSELKPIIPSRALDILQKHGASIDELADYSTDDLEAINGIGPKWAKDIYNSLALMRNTTPPEPDDAADTLDADYFEEAEFLEAGVDAIAAMLPEEPIEPTNVEASLEMALGYLEEVGRFPDAEILRGKVEGSGAAVVLETAIAILEGLQCGTLGQNLAQDVRESAGL